MCDVTMIGRPENEGPGGLVALQPEGWPAPKGYANGMMGRGQVIFVGGQIGRASCRERVCHNV